MKRLISVFLVVCMSCAMLSSVANASENAVAEADKGTKQEVVAEKAYDFEGEKYSVQFNEKKLSGTDIKLLKDDVLVGLNTLGELGVEVITYGEDRFILCSDIANVVCVVDSKEIYVNGKTVDFESAPVIKDSKQYISIFRLFPHLGFTINIDEDEKIIKAFRASAAENYVASAVATNGMYSTGEMISNGNMERNFNLYGDYYPYSNSSKLEWTDEFAHSGRYSLRVYDRSSGWSGVGQNLKGSIEAAGPGTYKVSGWIRNSVVPQKMNSALVVKTSDGGKFQIKGTVEAGTDDWAHIEFMDYLDWEGQIDQAYLMFETASYTKDIADTQPFFVDDISVEKMMNRDEFTTYITRKFSDEEKALSDSKEREKVYNQLVEKHIDDSFRVVYPKQNYEPIVGNPYRGFIRYSDKDITEEIVKGASNGITSILYRRFRWDLLEPREGDYQWHLIDDAIEVCKKNGWQFGTSLGSTLSYTSVTSYTEGVPDWVFDAGCGYIMDGYSEEAQLRIPKYDDPIFIEKYQNFIDAFAERYNDNPYIAYVDMRIYGNWGEWHFGSLKKAEALFETKPVSFFEGLIDMHKNVRLPMLALAKPSIITYAADKYGHGMRGDGTFNASLADFDKNFALVIGKSMSVAELGSAYPTDHKPGGKLAAYESIFPVIYELQTTRSQMSATAIYNWDADSAYVYWPNLYDRMVNKVGYYFKPVKIEYPSELTKGLFKLKIRNAGVAPLYAGYEKKAVVKLALADGENNIIDTVTLEGIDPMYFTPDAITNWAAEYEFKKTEGGEKLLFGIFTREKNEKPDIKLGIDADVIDGWYDISSMRTSDNQNFADNKQFSASELYAEEYYGFRRPEDASDGNDDTHWANYAVKGNYLEIDFDEEKDISSLTITGVDNVEVKFGIEVYRNGKWYRVLNGKEISSQSAEYRLRKEKGSKLRLIFDETKDTVVKIKEIVVK